MNPPLTNHQQIKSWVEARNGRPALINHPQSKADKVGLRINFPGLVDEQELAQDTNQLTTWEKFFEIFEQQQLAFVPLSDEKIQSESYRFIPR